MTCSPSRVASLVDVLSTLGPHSCPDHYNFHLHTIASDGQMHPHDVIDQALTLGLRGLAITDHHSIQGYQKAQHYLQRQLALTPPSDHALLPQLHLWSGVEINAQLAGAEVHLLGYDFDPTHRLMQPFWETQPYSQPTTEKVVAALHQAGGIVVLAHPFRYTHPGSLLITAAAELGVDGIETYYNYKNPHPWFPSPEQTREAEILAERYGLYKTCGTDSHGRSITRRI